MASAVSKKVKEKVALKLDDLLGKAHENVRVALNKRDIKTSTWLIDKLSKERGLSLAKGLLEPLVDALKTLDDVQEISKRALLMAIEGDMTFEQLKAVQEALARHSVLSGVIELRRLREEVESMTTAAEPTKMIGRDYMPAWGKLKDVTPVQAERGDAPPTE